MSDPFAQFARGLDSPAEKHFQITPSDTDNLSIIPRVIHPLSDGTIAVEAIDAITNEPSAATYTVFAGVELKLRVTKVLATGTTASCMGWV